ncbi:hypothetical protein pb186bvf_017275 [Paramecium bursaria]
MQQLNALCLNFINSKERASNIYVLIFPGFFLFKSIIVTTKLTTSFKSIFWYLSLWKQGQNNGQPQEQFYRGKLLEFDSLFSICILNLFQTFSFKNLPWFDIKEIYHID